MSRSEARKKEFRRRLECLRPRPNAAPRKHELELSILPDRWRVARVTESMVTLLRHFGVKGENAIRSIILKAVEDALTGGGELDKKIVNGDEMTDFTGMFRIAFMSVDPPKGHEAETVVAIVRRTLDKFAGK